MADGMKIKSIAPWFGGKRMLAPTIVDLIGKHNVYWEPFCGSMAVLMAKPPCVMETVNDLHGDLINLARVIQHRSLGEKLYDKLCRTLCAEQFFLESKERVFSTKDIEGEKPDLDRAYDFFVASWMGLNGVSGTKRCNYAFALRWTAGGGHGARRWASVLDSIPAWHERLRNVIITRRDGLEILENIDDAEGTAIYCDPPYFEKSSKYVHDFTEEQHGQLAQALQRFKKSKVIVSYFDHVKLNGLYAGWNKIFMKKSKANLANACAGNKEINKKSNQEVLLTNWTPETEKSLF